MDDSCPERNVTRFICEFGLEQKAIFCDDEDEITLTLEMIRWLTHDSLSHIPWLVEYGYLREVGGEKTYKVGQYFKWEDGIVRLVKTSPGEARLVGVSVEFSYFNDDSFPVVDYNQVNLSELRKLANFPGDYTPIPPPIITEWTVERKPGKCVHLMDEFERESCRNKRAMKFFNVQPEWLSCTASDYERYKTCPEYDDGES